MVCWCGCNVLSLLVVVVVDGRCLRFLWLFVVAWCVLFVVCGLSLSVVVVVLAGVFYWSRLLLGFNVCRVMVLLDVRCSLWFVVLCL